MFFRTKLLGHIKQVVLYQRNRYHRSLISTSFSFKNNLIKNRFWAFNNGGGPVIRFRQLSGFYKSVDNTNLRDELEELKNGGSTDSTPAIITTTESLPTTEEPPPTTEEPDDMSGYKLPENVIPSHYDLYLYPDLTTDSGNFRGKVTITVTVTETTQTIKLHNNGLTVETVTIDDEPCSYQLDLDHELMIITPENGPVNEGEAEIAIEFSGSMLNRIVGLYISSYTDENGEQRRMATSKFEPTYARQAYPCFDEPNMKATFTVHLLKPNDDSYIALSNMPVDGVPTDEGEEGQMVHFQKSVNMSTYLSCFIVSDFVALDPVEFGDGKQLRVYATREQLSKTVYAQTIGKSVIDYFTEYFGIPFPLPKLDMAAIPDFVSGAMEHWGLVTFRETALLYSDEISSSQNQQRVAAVVAHELAHSWFGNLVTMDWWSDLWLNEGFASYIEYKGVDHAEQDWQMLNQFIYDTLHPVLRLDATTASHPIVQTVHTPDEITAVFDTISYNKGASILRMLENAVGDDVFKRGVTKYLNDHQFGNAVTHDLWKALQEITEDQIEIADIMDTWTRQMGYPIIDITLDGDSYILKQRRYLTNPDVEDNTASPYDYKWTIPITYITKTDRNPELIWFKYTDDQVVVSKPASGWIKFNYHQIGYYRVNYATQDDWNNLIADIAELDIADRTHLIEETFSLAQSGTISYNIPLDLTKKLLDEFEYVPWAVLSSALQRLNLYLAESESYQEFKNYVNSIVANAYENLKWDENGDDDSHLTRRLRTTVLNLACLVGNEDCLNEAQQLFQAWLSTRAPLSQNLRSLVYTYGAAEASEEDWEVMYNIFAEEKDASEKLKLMDGLTYTPHESKLKKLMKIAETDGVVRSQDYFTLLAYISYNPVGNPIVWDYVRENWENLVERFGLNERYLGRMIPSITNRFTRQLRLDEMKDFFARYPEAGAGAAARVEALQTVENNIKWLEINKEVVENWLRNNVK